MEPHSMKASGAMGLSGLAAGKFFPAAEGDQPGHLDGHGAGALV